ncbi:Vi polysaccharide export inner membrane protein VexD [Tritonibacter multivorans]|uniref:Vi polysaccharide export inner membrane protein VexD n=1 Tax=Tritonibacter multivorans TaxID=928856 RepID=A0A0P1G4R0_9RHOB|nr:capsule biosynthesis protein [Tritonibacter multivorans]MDA7421829.1 capsule biosynthesis protein [Tritonibacter multivorans]CUH76795.1 Vi polysaccharide export inner membrane protein VexD [Tritonibacter multivorans]SFD06773.1 capsular polysaccharide transport system permease protein [Tritonibacter multivorans]
MTMKTKAKKYRIRRPDRSEQGAQDDGSPAKAEPVAAPEAGSAADRAQKTVSPTDGKTAAEPKKTAHNTAAAAMAGGAAMSPAAPPRKSTPNQALSTDIDAIRREGLTGRQLRLARRVAQKHNLGATSDYDAVRLLREKGIDPFQRSNMLELVVPQAQAAQAEGAAQAAAKPAPGLPATAAPTMPMPAAPAQAQTDPAIEALSPAERRAREIKAIQRDIARRRRRKLSLLLARLSAFVFLPTLVAGYYFYAMATPMYTSSSSLLVIKADGQGGGVGGLFSGTQFATSQEAVTAQDFLQSREAMQQLDAEIGFREHFSAPWIDPIQRLDADASNDEEFKIYKRNVKVGYDPTEGMVRLKVTAADPQIATDFSRVLIAAAQDRVNELSQKKRSDQVSYAEETLSLATQQRRDAQEELVRLQQQNSVLDPQGVIASLRGQISTFEVQLQEKELVLAALLDNTRPNKAKVDGARADISRLEAIIDRLNQRMVDASAGEGSLASMSVRIQMAQADLATRDMMLQSALQQLESTRMEADRQVRYLTTAVEPVPSDQPSHPRKFENTLLAFLIFSGIYLLCSLTASILREQVSS